MKVKTVLNKAAKCKTQEDAQALLELLQVAFQKVPRLHRLLAPRLELCNSYAYMEGTKPFVRFEINRVLSGYYITMIRPEISDGELVVDVSTNYMHDGLGLASQAWEALDGLEDTFTFRITSDQTFDEVVLQVQQAAVRHHAQLIGRLGVPHEVAMETAEKSW